MISAFVTQNRIPVALIDNGRPANGNGCVTTLRAPNAECVGQVGAIEVGVEEPDAGAIVGKCQGEANRDGRFANAPLSAGSQRGGRLPAEIQPSSFTWATNPTRTAAPTPRSP